MAVQIMDGRAGACPRARAAAKDTWGWRLRMADGRVRRYSAKAPSRSTASVAGSNPGMAATNRARSSSLRPAVAAEKVPGGKRVQRGLGRHHEGGLRARYVEDRVQKRCRATVDPADLPERAVDEEVLATPQAKGPEIRRQLVAADESPAPGDHARASFVTGPRLNRGDAFR